MPQQTIRSSFPPLPNYSDWSTRIREKDKARVRVPCIHIDTISALQGRQNTWCQSIDDYIAGLGLVFSFFCAPTFPRSLAIHTFHPVLYTYIYRTTSWIFHTAHAFATGKKTKLPGGAVPSETRRRASLGVHPPARPCKDTCAVFWLAIIGASLHLKCRHKYLDNLSTSIIHTHLAPGSRNSVGIAFLDTHSGFLGFNSHQVTFFYNCFFQSLLFFKVYLLNSTFFSLFAPPAILREFITRSNLKATRNAKFSIYFHTHTQKKHSVLYTGGGPKVSDCSVTSC